MGCGKTGRFLSCDYLGPSRKPDIVSLGKSITGGFYPASFVMGKSECMDLVATREAVSTYSFSPMAIAAVKAALRVIDDERLVERARYIQEWVLKEVKTWNYPFIESVKARGSDINFFLQHVTSEECLEICKQCVEHGVLVSPCLLRFRLNIPMAITDAELKKGISIIKSVFDTVRPQHSTCPR